MTVRARKYTKRVQIWQTTFTPDTFGGNVVSEELITTSWAKVRSVSSASRFSQRLTELGITDPTLALIVTVRFRDDIDYNAINRFLLYRGERYVIQNSAVNTNFFDAEVEMIVVKERTQSVPEVAPIP